MDCGRVEIVKRRGWGTRRGRRSATAGGCFAGARSRPGMPTGISDSRFCKVVEGGDRLVGDRENQVALGHAGLRGRAVRLEMDDLDAAFLGQAEEAGDGPSDRNVAPVQTEVAANDPPVLHELGEDPLDHVDRDREADSLGGMNDGRVHADHAALVSRATGRRYCPG